MDFNFNSDDDTNLVFDSFDHAYGNYTRPHNDPEQFLKFLDNTYNTKYLNLKKSRFLTSKHLEAFMRLNSKSNQRAEETKNEIQNKEAVINLNDKQNRKQYIEFLNNLNNDYNLLEAMQNSTKGMSINNRGRSGLQIETNSYIKSDKIKPPIEISPYNGLFLYVGTILSKKNEEVKNEEVKNFQSIKEFIYYMDKNIIKFSKIGQSNNFISSILRDELKIRYKSCINPNMYLNKFDGINEKSKYYFDAGDEIDKYYALERDPNNNLENQKKGYLHTDQINITDQKTFTKTFVENAYNLFQTDNTFTEQLKNYIYNSSDEFVPGSGDDSKFDNILGLLPPPPIFPDLRLPRADQNDGNPGPVNWQYDTDVTKATSRDYHLSFEKKDIIERVSALIQHSNSGNDISPFNKDDLKQFLEKAINNLEEINRYICYRENEDNFYEDNIVGPPAKLRTNMRIENYLINLENLGKNNNDYVKDLKSIRKNIENKDLRIENKLNENEMYLYSILASCNNEYNYNILVKNFKSDKFKYVYAILNLKNNLFYKYENFNFKEYRIKLNQDAKNELQNYYNGGKPLFYVSLFEYNVQPNNIENPFEAVSTTDYRLMTNPEQIIADEFNKKVLNPINRNNEYHFKLKINPRKNYRVDNSVSNDKFGGVFNVNDYNLYLKGIYFGLTPNELDFSRGNYTIPNEYYYLKKRIVVKKYRQLKKKYLCISPVFEIENKNTGIKFNFII
jgi:hypothetical protein